MSDKKPYYITTAIAYANGAPHIGHAYEFIVADFMARFKRLDGHDVFFQTGMDEFGQKIAQTAEKQGISPQELCDRNAAIFEDMTQKLEMSHDKFIRTTSKAHQESVQAIWKRLEENGDIYLDKYAGWYSVREEGYFDEKELVTDPATGQKLTPNGTEVEWVEEESFFFKLSAYEERLLKYYESNPQFIVPETRRNEIVSFVKSGLRDLSVSRTNFNWGVPVPGHDAHVMYVWLDALSNYISGIGYPDEKDARFQKFWPAADHVVGKDIIRFHCVYWPAFLMALNLPLPETVFAHGFINVAGKKMSKSAGNVVAPDRLLEIFGADSLRYLLLRDIPSGQDGNYAEDHAIQRVNSDLSNGLGNLAQRTLSMIAKNCDEVLPEPNAFTEEDLALLDRAQLQTLKAVREKFENYRFHEALQEIWKLVDEANGYVDAQAPWTLKKEDPERMKTVLYVLAETIRCLGLLIQPIMPTASDKILAQLGISKGDRYFTKLSSEYALKAGTPIPKPQGVFPRIEVEQAAE